MSGRRLILAGILMGSALALGAAPKKEKAAKIPPPTQEQLDKGKQVFNTVCAACHRADALGMPNMFPPLAGSDFLMADKKRAIRIVLGGLQGKVTVLGKDYNQIMPPLAAQLSDEQISNVLTYVRNNFGNKGEAVTPDEVKAARSEPPLGPGGVTK